jgi:DNA mismatch endonuclease (patch repair protein)
MADVFTKEKRSWVMSRIRSKNTKPEKMVFSMLRKQKIYFQKYYSRVTGHPDIVLPRKKVAIFIDGDFWHGYRFSKTKQRLPKGYWVDKIEGNMARDKKNRAKLRNAGWRILRVWEHEIESDLEGTTGKIIKFIKQGLAAKNFDKKCAGRDVLAIIAKDGKFYTGTNWCRNPQKKCPRLPGEDYSKCKSICKQDGHAETDAIKAAKGNARGGIMYLIGHDHCCDPCLEAMEKAGVEIVIFNKYPNGFVKTENGAK